MTALKALRHFIIDMDGVLYHGNQPNEGSAALLNELRSRGLGLLLLTNNSTLTPQQYVEKLARMDIRVSVSEILTSALATAQYLAAIAQPASRVYMIGENGLETALREAGFTLANHEVDFVVVGLDRHLTYEKLKIASLAIRAGAAYIATNPDVTLPTEEGLAPGIGAILAAISAATAVRPTVIGKPQPAAFRQALSLLQASPADTAAIGDRIETDIEGAQSVGLTTIFLLGGASSEDDVRSSPVRPDYVFPDMLALHDALSRSTG